jgi:hypothetical protein
MDWEEVKYTKLTHMTQATMNPEMEAKTRTGSIPFWYLLPGF